MTTMLKQNVRLGGNKKGSLSGSTSSLESTVTFGVMVAVGENNIGSLGSHLFFPAVGCELTSATISLGQKKNKTRIKKAEAAQQRKGDMS
ncbi:hypothetical protein PoB_006814900 [Plakobranchus ocellatus]|uniref:Uncharacterized protein n=1 Tax=Plakobranchus ocellatus TaxID=259542 RepID=A0AAV4DBR9_9GAST|nr:hypothetical protein PoB_006814900 [Plakobranchus ocellatus]